MSAILIAYDPAGNLFIVHQANSAILYNLVFLINIVLFPISICNENLPPLPYCNFSVLYHQQVFTVIYVNL